jgi:hypothetical protein
MRTLGLRDSLNRVFKTAGGEPHADGIGELHVGDASYDDWDVVADYPELETARAFHQALTDQGITAVLTADWPLDEWGRGDIALRVPAGEGIAAEELLDSD